MEKTRMEVTPTFYSGWTASDPPTLSTTTTSGKSFTVKDGMIEYDNTNNSAFNQKNVKLRMMGGMTILRSLVVSIILPMAMMDPIK